LDTPASDVRFVEAVQSILQAAIGEPDGVLAFEDVHWADEATLELVAFMVRRLEPGDHLVLTWRSDEVPEQHKLRSLLGELRRGQRLLHQVLGRLSASAVSELARMAPAKASISAERLYRETDGVPLFVVEYLAAGSTLEGDWPTPPTVAELVHRRLRRLGERERQIVSTAAVIGRSFSFDIVRAASGRSEEETVSAIETLVASAVLRPIAGVQEDGPAYDFVHERMRAQVYDSLDGSRRRLLHRRVAEALTQGAGLDALAGQAAQHFLLAGDSVRAAQLFETAGQKARALHAHTEAIADFKAAIDAGHESPAALHRQVGELLVLRGAYQAALTSLQLAAALSEDQSLAEVEHQIGNVYLRLGAWDIAEQHLASALAGFENAQPRQAARVLADRSLLMQRQGRDSDALLLAQQAIDLAIEAGDDQALAQAHNILGILATSSGQLDTAMHHLHECVRIAEALGDDGARIAGLNNLALAQRARGENDAAADLTSQALELCRAYGDRHREAALLNNLADISREQGLEEESMTYLKQAVTLFAEVGAGSGALEPEIWKLVKW
jgi:predicted ATPase